MKYPSFENNNKVGDFTRNDPQKAYAASLWIFYLTVHRQMSTISRTKSQHFYVSRIVLR